MPMDEEATPSKSKDVMYTISNYEDTRNSGSKPAHDFADSIQKARVTRAVPPKPAYDPLQFVQLKPCNLLKTAQENIKKAENVKKVQEEKKDEPEEWQCNLDIWKSSRRKRVEHIIDRVVEVKKYELEEHDRNRRKSKTFNEMMEQRGFRRLKNLPIYTDEDNNDLTELGLASKDKNSASDENDENKIIDNNNDTNSGTSQTNLTEYNEYTEAIEGYKSRVSQAGNIKSINKPESNSIEKTIAESSFKDENVCLEEILHPKSSQLTSIVSKVDFLKRKELFEKEQYERSSEGEIKRKSPDFISTVSIKERLSFLQLSQSHDISNENDQNSMPVLDTSFSDLRNRLEVFEREIKSKGNEKQNNSKVPYSASMQNPTNSSNINTEISSTRIHERSKNIQRLLVNSPLDSSENCVFTQKQSTEIHDNDHLDTDREDSGIHTTDVSCSVSQVDDQNEDAEQQAEDYQTYQKSYLSNNNNFETLPCRKPNFQDLTDVEDIYNDKVLDDALEMAFQEIDTMDVTSSQATISIDSDNISQNLNFNETNADQIEMNIRADRVVPYYQVPKSQEPYYEIPKTNTIPLYENVDIIRSTTMRSNETVDLTFTGCNTQDPPKEKPPPPPVEMILDDLVENKNIFKRINSTKRIKNEISNSRSKSFYIEPHDKNNDQIAFSQEFKTSVECLQKNPTEKNYLSKTRSCSDIDVIQDVSRVQNHSRQNSNLCTSKYNGPIEVYAANQTENQQSIIFNQYLQRSITAEANHWLIDNEFLKQENVQNTSNCEEIPHELDQAKEINPISLPIPPTKPLRSQQYNLNREHQNCLPNMPNPELEQFHTNCYKEIIYSNTVKNNVSLGTACNPLHKQSRFCKSSHELNTAVEIPAGGQTSKNLNERVFNTNEFGSGSFPMQKSMCQQRSQTVYSPLLNVHPTLKPSSSNNRHWLIQEAEQRRIDQQANIYYSSSGYFQNSSRKSLPDTVIQTITQRVQTLGIGTDRRCSSENSNNTNGKIESESYANSSNAQSKNHKENEDMILSVSGKKKCSHCNDELGRGAAMVIESLGLLYHLKCFKCFVCHTRLGDGVNGTDVRVRKYKLHCQNCFSSEDGIKFSCV